VVCTVFFCRMRAYSSKPVSETVLLQLRNVTSEEDKNILTEDDGGMMQPAGNAPSGLQETWTVCRERVAGPPVRSGPVPADGRNEHGLQAKATRVGRGRVDHRGWAACLP